MDGAGCPGLHLGGAGLRQGLWLCVSGPMRSQDVFYKGAIVPGASLVISLLGCLLIGFLAARGTQLWNGSPVKSSGCNSSCQPYPAHPGPGLVSWGGGTEGQAGCLSQQQ